MDAPAYNYNYGDLQLNFYRNRDKIPTIAHPAIEFKLTRLSTTTEHKPNGEIECNSTTYLYQNAGYQTSITLFTGVPIRIFVPNKMTGPPFNREMEWGWTTNYEYKLLESNDYVVIGNNPLNYSNVNN